MGQVLSHASRISETTARDTKLWLGAANKKWERPKYRTLWYTHWVSVAQMSFYSWLYCMFLYSYNVNMLSTISHVAIDVLQYVTFKPQPPVPILYFIHCSPATYLCVLCFESEWVEMRDRPDVVISGLFHWLLYKCQMWHEGGGGGILLNST